MVTIDVNIGMTHNIELNSLEMEILECICKGVSPGDGAEKVGISYNSYRNIRTKLRSILNASNDVETVYSAISSNLVKINLIK